MIKKFIRGWITGLAILPVRGTAEVKPVSEVQDQEQVLEKSLADCSVSYHNQKVYTGSSMGLGDKFWGEGLVVSRSGTWTNSLLGDSVKREFEEFIRVRTK